MPEILGRDRPPRLASPPSSPAVGELFYNTADSTLYWWNGAAWISARGIGFYSHGTLPIAGYEGQIAVVSLSDPAVSANYALMRYTAVPSPAGWFNIGRGRPLASAVALSSLTAATGWRKPTTTNTLTFPYAGSWQLMINHEVLVGAADVSCGVGMAISSAAASSVPTVVALGSGYTANARVNVNVLTAITVAAANEVWDERASTTASVALTFSAGRVWAEPFRIVGVV